MLLAAMTQSVVLPEQVFLMMVLPAASTSMPRSALVQLLPSMRLSLLVAWMPAPSPPLPLSEQMLPRITQSLKHTIPSRVLNRALQSATVLPAAVLMPSAALRYAEQFVTVQPKPASMPMPPFREAEQFEAVQPLPGTMPLL